MSHHLTRRALATGFIALLATPETTAAEAPADPVLQAIAEHRAAVVRDRQAMVALAHARAANAPNLAAVVAERKHLCKLRHSRRRDLRKATPSTSAGMAALATYYDSLVPRLLTRRTSPINAGATSLRRGGE